MKHPHFQKKKKNLLMSSLIVCAALICVLLQIFKDCHLHDDTGKSYELSLVGCKCIGAYVKNKKNQNQVCIYYMFLFHKLQISPFHFD